MLLLHRKQNQSVICHKDGDEDKPLVIRVCEVFPTHVTIGFEGDGWNCVRNEIFHKEESNLKGKTYEIKNYSNYYA